MIIVWEKNQTAFYQKLLEKLLLFTMKIQSSLDFAELTQ